ncbi:GNAT family N-acetyltransferase [Actinopolyspora mortivallis]|uniref:GNAT family N-acetyltransferase n=1 Tax=Actinopolyspora mortivallis TaxID=33906 RepID=UPI00038072BE|nr:GNAT family N-acetyltransferase [Actinopolyspora mortivallis]
MDTPAECFSSSGVGLRRWRPEDVDELVRTVRQSLGHLAPWMPWARHYDRDSALGFLRDSVSGWRSGKQFDFAVLHEHGLAGSVSLMPRACAGVEVGYWLHPARTGRGVMTTAVAVLTDEALRRGALRVEITHDLANVRSRGVPERLGYRQVGTLPPAQQVAPGGCGIEMVWRRERPLGHSR